MSVMGSGELDWNLIDTIDPMFLKKPQGLATMRVLCQQFLRAQSVPLDQPTRVLKLFQVLQVIIGYLCAAQDKLNEQIQQLTMDHQDIVGVIGLQCPICMKVFEALPYLDKHIFKRHGEVAEHWRNFRSPMAVQEEQAAPVSDEQIRMLFLKIRDEIASQRRESQREVNSLIRRNISQVEQELESLKMSLRDQGSRTPTPKRPKKANSERKRRLSPFRSTDTERSRPIHVLSKSDRKDDDKVTPKKRKAKREIRPRETSPTRTPTFRQIDFDESGESESTDAAYRTQNYTPTGAARWDTRRSDSGGTSENGSSENDYMSN